MPDQELQIKVTADTGSVTQGFEAVQNAATQAMSRTAEQIERARASADFLAQSIDLKIPQALEGVLAKSELLGPALEAAFPVTAGLAFAGAIADVANKLSQLISDTYIYTDAEKEAYNQLTSENRELLQIADRTKQLRRERMLLEAPDEAAKDKLKLQFQIEDQRGTSKDYADRAKAKMKELADLQNQTVTQVDSEVGGTAVVFTQLFADTEEGKKKIAQLNAEITILSKLSEQYGEAERIAADEARQHQAGTAQVTGAMKQKASEQQVITVQAQKNRIQATQQGGQAVVADYQQSLAKVDQLTQQSADRQVTTLVGSYENESAPILKASQQRFEKLEAQQAASLERRRQAFDRVFKGISGEFTNFVNGLLSGHETLGQAWTKMVDDMASNFISGLERQLMSFLEHKLMEVTIHANAEVAKDQASKAAHAKEDERTAYSAAKAAWESVVHTPIVGPILAPIAAAATFAAVTAFGSAEGGQYIVPSEQLTMLHRNEMVLPAGVADRMRGVIEGGGGGGVTVVVNHSVSAVDAESFQAHLRRHANLIGQEVARMLKKKALAPV
jgi:tetrahydromethanopterin S-methyltransferase subunit B